MENHENAYKETQKTLQIVIDPSTENYSIILYLNVEPDHLLKKLKTEVKLNNDELFSNNFNPYYKNPYHIERWDSQ
jgi:hypothetical protein